MRADEQELNRKIGANLRKCRKQKNVTQAYLAEQAALLGLEYITQNRVSKLESGLVRLSAVELVIFSKTLGVSPSEIMN